MTGLKKLARGRATLDDPGDGGIAQRAGEPPDLLRLQRWQWAEWLLHSFPPSNTIPRVDRPSRRRVSIGGRLGCAARVAGGTGRNGGGVGQSAPGRVRLGGGRPQQK